MDMRHIEDMLEEERKKKGDEESKFEMFKIHNDPKMNRRKTLRTNSKITLPINPKGMVKRNSFNEAHHQMTSIVSGIVPKKKISMPVRR